VRSIGFIWGVGGILLLLSFAIVRLGGVALELNTYDLSLTQWLLMSGWFAYMVWAEGYKGFHLAFAPRVVARASYLADNPRPVHVLLAPLFCMGYVHATPRRRILSIALSCMIVCFVLLARMLPQPWRGIVDVGVVAGLVVGVGSIVYYLLLLKQAGASSLPVPTDVPV
jgi:glucose uptake protein GlcU